MIKPQTSVYIAQAVASEMNNSNIGTFAEEYDQLSDELKTLQRQMLDMHQSDKNYVHNLCTTMRHIVAESIQLYAVVENIQKQL